jgi:hypothetical protein
MTRSARRPNVHLMKGTVAVLWSLHGPVHSGSLEAFSDRLELRTRGRTCSIPLGSIAACSIERGPSVRMKGLPVLRVVLAQGDVIRIASLEGMGVLHELAMLLAPARAAV